MHPYIRAVHSRLAQLQPEVGLAGPGSPVHGTRGVPCLPMGSSHVIVVLVSVAVHQIVEGSRQVGRDIDNISDVERAPL